MREIKFKAWHNDKKVMLMAAPLNFWFQACIDKGLNPLDQDVVMLQYAGLKDKNKKEIYEGDLVAFEETVMSDVGEDKPNYIDKRIVSNFKYASGQVGERRYGREIKLVEWKNDSCGFEPFSDSQENCGQCGGGDNSEKCEVIGNIYENPELLGI